MLLHIATVVTALNGLYNNYLKAWAVPLAAVGIAGGGLMWMALAAAGNHSAHVGLRAAFICMMGIAIIFGAIDLVNIGKTLAV